MSKEEQPISALLHALYDNVDQPDRWPTFLEQLAAHFHSPSASLRITGREKPSVYQSFTIGLDQGHEYDRELAAFDPFRVPLANGSLGKVHLSQDIISDRAFERSDHYQLFFRPNGNFYAMGTQFDRYDHSAMHIGIHRPYHRGAFTEQECRFLEGFSRHLRRVAQLTRLVHQVQESLLQARTALDALPFGVFMLDTASRCQWHNRAAEEALVTHYFGLKEVNGRLSIADGEAGAALQLALRLLRTGKSPCESIRLSAQGASLVLIRNQDPASPLSLNLCGDSALIAFLLDPQIATPLDHVRLQRLYSLTAAELRLVDLLVRGLDLNEASACLCVTTHTTRSQLKSIMQKTEVSRQSELIRKLLLSVGVIRCYE